MIRYWCICLVLLVTEVLCCPIPCQCSADLKVVNCTNPDLVVTPEGRVLPIMDYKPGWARAAVILTEVPQNLPHQMETLVLSHNEIREIKDNAFQNYKNLKNLYMDDCQIGSYGIGDGSLAGLDNLEKLVLRDNYIAKLPLTMCQHVPNLAEIYLDNNKLTSIPIIDFCDKLRVESLARNVMACESSYQVWERQFTTTIPGRTFSYSTSNEIQLFPPQHHCLQRKFRYLPSTLFRVEKLDISGMGMDFIWNNTFKNLPWLKDLNLSYNKLQRLENSAFSEMWSLEKLDLSYNKIDFISPFAFLLDLEIDAEEIYVRTDLTHLSLRGNRIRRLNDTRTFRNMLYLTDLDLSDNQLYSLSPGMFHNLEKLKFLNMSNNDLLIPLKHDYSGYIFAGLGELRILDLHANGLTRLMMSSLEVMSKLESLDVRDNTFQCDIHLIRLGHWANVSSVRVINRDGMLPCLRKNEDRLNSLLRRPRWLDFEKETIDCVSWYTFWIFVVFAFISWSTKMRAWLIQAVLTDPVAIEQVEVDDAADFEHDIFISFSDSDRDFVENNLLSLGTENNGPYRLWYDCPMGGRILTEISDAMKNSRMAVIVITDAYFQSRQKIDEFNELLFRQKENRNFQLAFVTYGDNLDLTKLPNVAHYPLTSSGFVAFSDQGDMKILRARLSARLDRPLTRWEKVLKAFNDTKTNIEAWYQFLRGIARAAMANNVEPA